MLNVPNLDDQRFDEIVEEAIRSIPYVYPEWTDHNAHDPGITMLELFAWYKEMQQYHLNVTTQRTLDMYLKLLGRRRADARAARAYVVFEDLEKPVKVEKGQRLLCEGGAELEFDLGRVLGQVQVSKLAIAGKEGAFDITEILQKDHLPMEIFKDRDARFYIALEGEAFRGGFQGLWVEVFDEYPVKRNPFEKGQIPGRLLRFEDGHGRPLTVVRDGTYAFCQTGEIELHWSRPERSDPIGLGEAYWIAVSLEDSGCEESVRLMGISAAYASLTQKNTLVETLEFTHESGEIHVPLQTPLARRGKCLLLGRDAHGYFLLKGLRHKEDGWTAILPKELAKDGQPNIRAIFYEEWVAPFLTANGNGKSGFVWQLGLGNERANPKDLKAMGLCRTPGGLRYTDWNYEFLPYTLGPYDKGFGYDRQSASLTFGDNERGAVAPEGEESLILTGLSTTRGAAGRFPQGQKVVLGEVEARLRVSLLEEGRDEQTTAEVKAQLMQDLSSTCKAVTPQDYANLAMQTPGLRVERAAAVPGFDPLAGFGENMENAVTVAVKPYGEGDMAQPDEHFLQMVQEHLDRYRPICTYVRVVQPLYIRINLNLTVVSRLDQESLVKKLSQAAKKALLKEGQDWPLGQPVTVSELIAALGEVPEVLAVKQLGLTSPSARVQKNQSGDLLLPPHALPYLGALDVYTAN